MTIAWKRATAACIASAACAGACSQAGPPSEPEVVFSYQSPTWYEDGWSFYDVAPGADRAVFGARFGRMLFDLRSGGGERADLGAELTGELASVADAFFDPDGRLWRRGARNGREAWYAEGSRGLEAAPLPPDAAPRPSPDGSRVAYYRGTAGSGPSLFVGPLDAPVELDLGGLVTGFGWAPDGKAVYALAFGDDGASALHRVAGDGSAANVVRDGLDAPARFNSVAVTGNGRHAYLALAGAGPPDPEARHRPRSGRNLDLYRIDLDDGSLEAAVVEPGDDVHPQIRAGHLYWTHNAYDDRVVVVPIEGGEVRGIVGDAQIPYWDADGRRIAFTVGGWMLADWALNMDAWVVDVDEVGDRVSEPRPLIEGYHEDFTPAWSPDGRWLAYHSHRAGTPVPHYFASGGTDDVYIREDGNPSAPEIRVIDFGWEVGLVDWDRTGTRLVFDSWERGGPAGVAHPWIATIDPASGEPVSVERLPLPDSFGGTVLAAWSPVADELAVVERVEGHRHALWILPPDGSGGRRVAEFEAATYGGVDWTPDGTRLVFGALDGERMQLFAVGARGGEPARLTRDEADVLHPQVSPDGRWIAASWLRHLKELRRVPLG